MQLNVRDLDEALEQCADDIGALDKAHVFFTGGTGFVGKWLLAVLLYGVQRLGISVRVTIPTRDPERFRCDAPSLANNCNVTVISADVRHLPESLPLFDAVVHAATPTDARIARENPGELVEIALDGTREVLRLAGRSGSIPFLFTSSGAVYGKQPSHVRSLAEDMNLAPETTSVRYAYHESKRMGEMLCTLEHQRSGLLAKIARLFAFLGPHLPLEGHYAIGNFVRDAIDRSPIRIQGDGTTVRSYLYSSDMSAWLWKILVRGETLRPYNVGSSHAVTLRDLAALVQEQVNPGGTIEVLGSPVAADDVDRYVPDTTRVVTELGLHEIVSLVEGIQRFAGFAAASRKERYGTAR